MIRSMLIRSFTVVLMLLGHGCTNATLPMPIKPTTEPAPSADEAVVQMCVPGTTFILDARYVVVKAIAHSDLLFRRVDYRCNGKGIEFRLQIDAARADAETCEGIVATQSDIFPDVLFLTQAEGLLPAVYSRLNILATIFHVVAKNPCGGIPVAGLPTMR